MTPSCFPLVYNRVFRFSFCNIYVLFVANQIARRRNAHMSKYPDAQVISLGIGDTTEPIPEVISTAMSEVFTECQ